MTQCLYIDDRGRQCRNPAEEAGEFCLWHQPASGVEPPLIDPGLRRWIFRLAALLLLGIFLLPLLLRGYYLLRSLIR